MASIAPPAHTRSSITTDDWITPKWLIERLGLFDLDPCESEHQPWPCAKVGIRHKPLIRCGLSMPWKGTVWMNPPYGSATSKWLNKLAKHNDGMALIFARTETRMFFDHVWPKARAILFLRGRLTFCFPDGSGSKAGHNSGGPSCLIAYGEPALRKLVAVADLGKLLQVN